MNQSFRHHQQGDISIYIAISVVAIMASALLLFSGLLIGQLSTTHDVIDSERAFYAANAGMERGLYELSLFATPAPIPLADRIEYSGNAAAVFVGSGAYAADGVTPCIRVTGAYPVREGQEYPGGAPQAQERRLRVGPADCSI